MKYFMTVAALTANSSVDLIEQQAREFCPRLAVLYDEDAARELRARLSDTNTQVLSGMADDHAREQRIKVNEPEGGRLIVRRKDEILEHVADDPAQPVHGGGNGEVQRERIHVAAVGRQLAGGNPLIFRAEALQEIGGKLLRAVGRIALAQPPVGEGHAHEVGDHEPRRRVGQPHGNAVRHDMPTERA